MLGECSRTAGDGAALGECSMKQALPQGGLRLLQQVQRGAPTHVLLHCCVQISQPFQIFPGLTLNPNGITNGLKFRLGFGGLSGLSLGTFGFPTLRGGFFGG